MNEANQDAPYWRSLREALEAFVGNSAIEKYLFNAADFGELSCLIFDDLNAKRRFENLPDHYSDLRSYGTKYVYFLDYMIGSGSNISRDAPIYDANERKVLFSRTAALLTLIDQLIDDLERA